jgi:hypothetical protein
VPHSPSAPSRPAQIFVSQVHEHNYKKKSSQLCAKKCSMSYKTVQKALFQIQNLSKIYLKKHKLLGWPPTPFWKKEFRIFFLAIFLTNFYT